MDWPDKIKVWELCYLVKTPIERIRREVKWDNAVTPSWKTVKRAIDDFPLLTPAQVGRIPDALQARWRELQPCRSYKEQQAPGGDIGKRAQLQIEFNPARLSELGLIHYSHSPLTRKFARISVTDIGEETAHRSWGVLKILAPEEALGKYPRDLKLHWVDAPYGLEMDSAHPVDIQVGVHKLLDVVFSQPSEDSIISKLPEPKFGKTLTSGPLSVIVGGTESAKWEQPVPGEGCWIADNIALVNPSVTVPGYMPPERYVVEVMVGCDNGQGDTKCFEIISPLNWLDLEMTPASPPQSA